MNYFKDIENLEELRKEYKRLVKQYHPDNGGDLETIKVINAKYEAVFEALKNADTSNEDASRYDREMDEAIRAALQKVIKLNINIEIIGCWIWCNGSETYHYRTELKKAGFRFSGNRKSWYWHSDDEKKKGKSKRTLEELRQYYGNQKIKEEGKEKQIRLTA